MITKISMTFFRNKNIYKITKSSENIKNSEIISSTKKKKKRKKHLRVQFYNLSFSGKIYFYIPKKKFNNKR